MQGVCWIGEEVLASEETLCSIEVISSLRLWSPHSHSVNVSGDILQRYKDTYNVEASFTVTVSIHCRSEHSLYRWVIIVKVSVHCQREHSLAKWTFTVRGAFTSKVTIHCQGPHSLPKSAFTVEGQHSLSRSAFTVKISIHCQGQHSLSRSAFTVEGQHSLSRSAFTVKVSVHCHVSIHLRLRTPCSIKLRLSQFVGWPYGRCFCSKHRLRPNCPDRILWIPWSWHKIGHNTLSISRWSFSFEQHSNARTEPTLRSRQLLSCSINFPHFLKPTSSTTFLRSWAGWIKFASSYIGVFVYGPFCSYLPIQA